jgi:hypothetical protein
VLEKNGTDTHPSYLLGKWWLICGTTHEQNNGDRSTGFYDLFILCMAKVLASVEMDTKRHETLLLFEVMKLF